MLAKVIAHGPTRSEAAGRLARALERLHLAGVRTNRDFLAATLRHPEFLAGRTTTDFIERATPAVELTLSDEETHRAAVAGALWLQGENRVGATVLSEVPSGWRNGRLPPQRVSLGIGDRVVDVQYASRRDGTFAVGDGSARVHHWTPDSIDVEVDGHRATHRVTRAGDRLYVQVARGTVDVDVVPRFVVPGSAAVHGGAIAPMPGTVLDVRVAVGDRVVAGQTVVVLEAMKMEHHLTVHAAGAVTEVHVTAGAQVEKGTVLLVIDEDGEAGDAGGDG
jgi:propionyl-CoA carboxylase alpha chain